MTELSIQVSRLSGGPLELNDGEDYAIIEVAPGATAPQLQFEESPVSNGSVLVGRKYPMSEARLVVRCYGTNAADCLVKAEAVKNAFQTWGYTITITTDSYTDVIECHPARVAVAWDPEAFTAGWCNVEVIVPRQP